MREQLALLLMLAFPYIPKLQCGNFAATAGKRPLHMPGWPSWVGWHPYSWWMSSAGLTPPIAYEIFVVPATESTTATPGAAVAVYAVAVAPVASSVGKAHPSKVSSASTTPVHCPAVCLPGSELSSCSVKSSLIMVASAISRASPTSPSEPVANSG